MRRDASTPITIDRPEKHYLHCPTSLMFPVSRLIRCLIHLSVSLLPLSLLSQIYNVTIVCRPYPTPTLSEIPIIPHLYCASIVILPRLCCSPHRIIFHRPMYFATVVCLHYRIGSSTRSASFYTTLLAPLCSAQIFSLSALIFLLRFSFLFGTAFLSLSVIF